MRCGGAGSHCHRPLPAGSERSSFSRYVIIIKVRSASAPPLGPLLCQLNSPGGCFHTVQYQKHSTALAAQRSAPLPHSALGVGPCVCVCGAAACWSPSMSASGAAVTDTPGLEAASHHPPRPSFILYIVRRASAPPLSHSLLSLHQSVHRRRASALSTSLAPNPCTPCYLSSLSTSSTGFCPATSLLLLCPTLFII